LYNTRERQNFSENSTGDMAFIYSQLDKLIYELGSALVVVHHFSKGSQANKSAIDRTSGSGVTGRDFDTLVMISELEEVDAYRMEFILREFKCPDPINLRWEYPLHIPDEALQHVQLKGSSKKNKSVSERARVLQKIGDTAYKYNDLKGLIMKTADKAGTTAERWIRDWVDADVLEKRADGTYQQFAGEDLSV
jgi:hypothetical protein